MTGTITPVTTITQPYWVDGGPLHGWAVVHSRLAHPVGVGARFMFTRIGEGPTAPVIQGWTDYLRLMGVVDESRPARVFWRLTVRQRSIALNAQTFTELADAIDNARQVTRRAAELRVSFAFFPGEPIPRWVIRDGDVVVFVGLPHHHLVGAPDPRASLATLVAGAQVRTKVHEVGPAAIGRVS